MLFRSHGLLQPRVLAQQDGNVSHKGDEADDAADDVFLAREEGLARRVEFRVVGEVVVAFGEEAEGGFTTIMQMRSSAYSLHRTW